MGAAECQTIIAVDNGKAGEDCHAIIPTEKDWNENLICHDHL